MKREKDDEKNFMTIDIKMEHEIIEIRLELLYTNIDIYTKSIEFEKYFHGLVKTVSFNYDPSYQYFLHGDKMKKLLSLLSLEEYEKYLMTKKYNL